MKIAKQPGVKYTDTRKKVQGHSSLLIFEKNSGSVVQPVKSFHSAFHG